MRSSGVAENVATVRSRWTWQVDRPHQTLNTPDPSTLSLFEISIIKQERSVVSNPLRIQSLQPHTDPLVKFPNSNCRHYRTLPQDSLDGADAVWCCVVVLPREEELRNDAKPSPGGRISCRDKRRDGSRMASPRGWEVFFPKLSLTHGWILMGMGMGMIQARFQISTWISFRFQPWRPTCHVPRSLLNPTYVNLGDHKQPGWSGLDVMAWYIVRCNGYPG